jgi:hypothetical protein
MLRANEFAAMKTKSLLLGLACAVAASMHGADAAAPASARVGVYDSRAVAFAYFWSPPIRKQRDELIVAAKSAKDAGDEKRLGELKQEIVAGSKQTHLQVFSTAPATEAMAALQGRLPAIQKELGVERLVSKWDRAGLQGVPEANRVEVTDRLVREFDADEKRLKSIAELKTKPPLPLWQAKLLLRFGGM